MAVAVIVTNPAVGDLVRRVSQGALVGSTLLLAPSVSHGDEGVPISRQVELLVKVIPYDKNFESRAADVVRVALIAKSGADGASRAAAQISAALSGVSIGGRSVELINESYSSPGALAQSVRDKKLAVVYLLPGLGGDVDAIAEALSGTSVLSVTTEPELVAKRVVLGFDLVSGKPKIVVHLTQARAQSVEFKAEVLKLMKVYE